MKMIFSMLLSIVVIVGFYSYLLGGGGMFSFFKQTQEVEEKPKGVENISNAVTDKKVTVYQWVDEHGVKHYSNTPPIGHNKVDTLHLSPDTNVLQAVKVEEKQEEKPKGGGQVSKIGEGLYSPEGVKDLMQQTQDVQDVLNKRMEEQQKMMDQLSGANKK